MLTAARLAHALVLSVVVSLAALPASRPAAVGHPPGDGSATPTQEPTAPALVTRVAFGSCLRQDRPAPVWEAVRALEPDVFLFLGDAVYADTEEPAELRARWAELAASPGFAAVRERTTLLATWDDHDYGRDDAGADYPARAESQAAFLDFLGVAADSPRRAREGVYHAETVGPPGRRVQVILLDTRYHRSPLPRDPLRIFTGEGPYSPTDDAATTLLGAEQWRWLEERLREPAELRLLVSSVQLVAEEHRWEGWANLPHERARLLELLARTRANGVIVLSGDRHAAEISRLETARDGRDPGYALLDVTASALNQSRPWRDERNRWRVGDLFPQPNFGTLEIDWERADPTVEIAIRDVEGRAVLRAATTLGALAPPPAREPVSAERLERIAFGSCNRQDRPTPLWKDVLAAEPELMLLLGDNVYADTADMDVLRASYAALASQPGYSRLRERVPVLATWDDHDYFTNDAGAEHPRKRESQRVFLEFFREPAESPRWTREGVYGSWLFGPPAERVQVILLDLRWHRSPWKRRYAPEQPGAGAPGDYAPNLDPEATMLGAEQWRWLEEELRVPARLRLVGSSLQVLTDGSRWECWAMMPRERERLFRTIRESGASGVVLLSGDTHWAELARIDPADSGVAYPLWELTSSGLNQGWSFTNVVSSTRVGVPIWEPNWGLVTIDWERTEPVVTIEAIAEDGRRLRQEIELGGLW